MILRSGEEVKNTLCPGNLGRLHNGIWQTQRDKPPKFGKGDIKHLIITRDQDSVLWLIHDTAQGRLLPPESRASLAAELWVIKEGLPLIVTDQAESSQLYILGNTLNKIVSSSVGGDQNYLTERYFK